MEGRGEVPMLSSNNYLGLAGRAEVVEAGIEGLRRYGAGTASVRFICGTSAPHLELERELCRSRRHRGRAHLRLLLERERGGVPMLTDESTVILSDALNHASIIDAIRLSRPAAQGVYAHSSMDELRDGLRVLRARAAQAGHHRRRLLDGGRSRAAAGILELAREHDAVVLVDDSHGTGVMGADRAGRAPSTSACSARST